MIQLQLPTFEAKRSKDFPSFLIVHCPREDCCGRPFLVDAREWLRPKRYTSREKVIVIHGRACPYCFKAGAVPRRSEIS